MLYVLNVVYIVTLCGSCTMLVGLLTIPPIIIRLQDKRAIRRAKRAEIGEGVTLLQGIRACFGEDGFWSALTPELVYIYVSDPRLFFAVEVIRGPGRKYRLIPQISDHHHHWAEIDERDVAFSVMIEAVKAQETIIEM